jgi:serine/threonine protein kinase
MVLVMFEYFVFGLTCSNLLTLTTKKVGTHVWRAPEVLLNNNGRVNPRRSDIYSFGMVCFEILSGEILSKNCVLNNEELLNNIEGLYHHHTT